MVGIDLGSRTVKIVVMEQKTVVKTEIYHTIEFYRQFSSLQGGQLVLDKNVLGLNGERITATGYGKMTLPLMGAEQIPEIQAHACGAAFQSGYSDFTLIDIGGQDTKVICVRKGKAVDFLTNDRCASGSGRYLENMAHIIGIGVGELGRYDQEPVPINTTCAIFGETEIIARIIEGYTTEQLAAGVNWALYKRISPMLKKMKSDLVLMAGGGALNQAIAGYIRADLKVEVELIPHPQFNGAIGCCIWQEENSQ